MCHDTEKEARASAEDTLQRMKSCGWETEVWENLGWHWSLINGPLSLSMDKHKGEIRYSCMMADEPNPPHSCGSLLWGDTAASENPNVAVDIKVAMARKAVDVVLTAVEYAENI